MVVIMINNGKAQYNAIINYLKTSNVLRKFKYYDSFSQKWMELLKKHFENDCLFVTKDISDSDQTYKYEYQFFSTKLVFEFSIPYIRYFFFQNQNLFPVITLNNKQGDLMYGESYCVYTHYDSKNCNIDYENMNDIFIIPFPSYPLSHVVIDGNHRLSLQVNKGNRRILVRYCPIEICERSIMSAFQVALYSCLFDCSSIEYNMNRATDLQIKKHLKVFNSESFINNIDKRKNN